MAGVTSAPIPWKGAWQRALYGEAGFFLSSRPAQHFRTNSHIALFAEAIAEVVRRSGSATVVDLGAGEGELLKALHGLEPDVELIGVELGSRPAGLPGAIDWATKLPTHIDGLLIANEWLDNVPCDVVEVDHDGVTRVVCVDPATGAETLGEPVASAWIDTWWPLREPGERAEVGTARDVAWADAVARVDGMAIAIDYGHQRGDRPAFGTLRSYLHGHEADVIPDGSRDVTAHVAVDSVAEATGAHLLLQRDALRRLGLSGARPPIELAHANPRAYLQALGRSGELGELVATGGLGDFWWIVTDTLGRETLSA